MQRTRLRQRTASVGLKIDAADVTDVADAHLAALAIGHGTGICSFDSDFARFTDVLWINPNRR